MTEEETIDIKTIEEWQKILDEFSQHQIEIEETFMGVCRYKWERFEEICSRVLKFFFDPNEKHGFRDLWFKALCQLIEHKEYCNSNLDELEILLEDPTKKAEYDQIKKFIKNPDFIGDIKKKKIDIVLKHPKFVITIENKIDANLYNYLYIYKNHIDNCYPDIKDKHFYVLTAHTIDEAKLKDRDPEKAFEVKKYEQLFKNVESLLGKYIAKGEQKYLTFMLDFIQTIRNMVKEMELTEFENSFFADNKTVIGKMTKKYNTWKNDVLNTRNETTSKLRQTIEDKTSIKWELDTYKDVFLYNLSIKFKEGTKYKIGIESNFDFDDEKNSIGVFRIFITTWDMACWEPYEKIIRQKWQELKKKYPTRNFNEFDDALDKAQRNDLNRVYLHLPPIERKNFNDDDTYQEEIVKKLNECYDFLKEITGNIDK